MSDRRHMGLALSLAEEAAAAGETPVGCVIVDEASGEVVASAANGQIGRNDPTAHAEILALRGAAEATGNYRLRPGLTLYVTLEPCAMCAGAISHARIARVVYGASDPKSGGVAHGAKVWDHPQCHWKPAVASGVEAEAAAKLLKDFFKARRNFPSPRGAGEGKGEGDMASRASDDRLSPTRRFAAHSSAARGEEEDHE